MVIIGTIRPRLLNMQAIFAKTIRFDVLIVSLCVYDIGRYCYVCSILAQELLSYCF